MPQAEKCQGYFLKNFFLEYLTEKNQKLYYKLYNEVFIGKVAFGGNDPARGLFYLNVRSKA